MDKWEGEVGREVEPWRDGVAGRETMKIESDQAGGEEAGHISMYKTVKRDSLSQGRKNW